MGGPHCQSLELLSEQSEPSPELSLEVYLAPGLPRDAGFHRLCPQLCSLGRIQSPRFIYSYFLSSSAQLHALYVSAEPGLCAQLSQQSDYPTSQQEQLHLGPLTRTFFFFCFSSLPYDQHCWATSLCCPGPAALLLCTSWPCYCQCNSLGSKPRM